MRCFAKVLTASWCLFFASLLGAPTANAADGGRPASSARVSSGRETAAPSDGAAATLSASAQQAAAERYGDLPLSFEANQGQTDSQVRFLSRGSGYSFFLTQAGAVLSFSRDAHSDAVLRMQLAGASPNAPVQGLGQLPGKSNYFFGSDSSRWRTGVPTYSRVKYENVYPGISLVYYGNQRQLEYDFVVAPGADPRQIRLSVAGAQKLTVDAQGNLVLHNSAGEVQLLAPKVYQQIDGERHEIAGQWKLQANHVAGFRLGAYDRTRTLVIDPVLTYSSFLGGSQKNALSRIAIDAAGNAYVAGYTTSGDFPAAPTPLANTFGAGPQSRGAFVAKIDPTGSNLLYSTYLSGSSDEEATGLAVDSSGDVYLAGNTHSADFPTSNALQSTCPTHTQAGTCASAFLTEIGPSGESLLFSTYLGGSGGDSASGLAIDSTGSAYVAGSTSSLDFPVTSGAAQTKCGGACQQNAFVAKFSPSGTGLAYATYLGGSGVDGAADLAVDSSGNVYLAGHTTSADFPLATPFQKTCTPDATSTSGACIATAFVAKLKADGSAFVYSTYLGGSLGSQAAAIAVDAAGSAYVTGSTQSSDFPLLKPYQKSCGIDATSGKCSVDVFLTKFAPTGKALVYSTYLGGSGQDQASGIAVDAAGNAHIVGTTESANFPTAAPTQPQLKGSSDAFVALFNATGSSLAFSTYHGGSATESGNGIALDAKNNVYVTGETSSPDFPTLHPFQSSCAGACTSAFVSKMTSPPAGTPASITPVTGTTPQSAVVNTAFATALAAIVLDSSSNPVSGVVVTFTAPSTTTVASGTFSDTGTNTTTATTDATGTATIPASFTANPFAGNYTVNATINALETGFVLTNTAGTVNKVTFVGGTTPQSAVVNNAFANNLAVKVVDASNNPLGGLTVTFTAPNTTTAASGVFTDSATNTTTAVTDITGTATAAVFTANPFAGAYTVTGGTAGKSVNFALTNTAGTVNTVTAVTGTTPQTAVVNNAFTHNLAVTVLDAASKPLGGLTVTFTAPSTTTAPSGVFTDSGTNTTTATTDINGTATAAVFTANPFAGAAYTVGGATAGKTANFSLTNTAGTVTTVTTVTGTTPQSAVVNNAFTTALAVTVLDAGSKPLGGLTVTFTAPTTTTAATGVFSDSGTNTTTAVTNINGVATAATFTANSFPGAYNVTGATGGKTGTFALTNTAGTVSTVTPVTGTTPQNAVVNNAFTTALGVTVLDSASKPLAGLTVTFTAPTTTTAASGVFTDSGTNITTATTNASGVATAAVFTANPFAGGYTVTGATGGKSGSFALTNKAGTVTTVTAVTGTTPQSAVVNNTFTNAPAVTVLDVNSKPLGGLTVTFTAPSTTTAASGNFADSGTNTTTATTNISGVATAAAFTANPFAGGPYTVSGATGGVTANLSFTNTAGTIATVTAVSGSTPQSTVVNTAFAKSLGVTVLDGNGKPLGGLTVAFAAPTSNSLTPTCFLPGNANTANVSTNINGVASVVCTANTVADGPTTTNPVNYPVLATVSGNAVQFTLTNLPGAPTTITPVAGSTPQSTPVKNFFTNNLSGTVTDQFGNAELAGTIVTFAPPSGASGTFAGGANTASTNSSGVFTAAVFTANSTAGGPYNVAASAGAAAVNYSLTNTDFTLLQTPPTSSIYIQGQNAPIAASAPPMVTVTQQFGYTGVVTLSCASASFPSGVTCPGFSPATAGFTNGTPASVLSSLTLNTAATTPVGLYTGSSAQNVVSGADASPTSVINLADFTLAIQCTLTLQQTLPTFTPAVGDQTQGIVTPNQYSIGVAVAQGGSACPYGSVPVAGGITPAAASGDGTVVTPEALISGQSATIATGTPGTVVFEVAAAPAASIPPGSVTVPYFDATQNGNINTLNPMPVGLEVAVPVSVVAGGTIAPFSLPITLPQAANNTVTVPNANMAGVTTVCGAVNINGPDPQNFGITCTATATSSSVQLSVSLPAQVAASRSRDRGLPAMLFALALGFPAIVFLSVGASAFAPRERKRGFHRVTCILGILLLLSLLVLLPACGGGFKANFVTASTNTYTLTVMGYVTDSSSNVVGIDVFTVLLTVN
jgi:hypothetical protein